MGDITSSNKYNNLKLGKAIAINTNAGVIVQISSIKVAHFKLLVICTISYTIKGNRSFLSVIVISRIVDEDYIFIIFIPADYSLSYFKILTLTPDLFLEAL